MRPSTLFAVVVTLVIGLLSLIGARDASPKARDAEHVEVPATATPSLPSSAAPREAHGPQRTVPSAHLLAVPLDFAEPDAPAGNPALERAFGAEPEDAERADQVANEARAALAADPQLEVHDVRCTPTFCRLRMTKPIESALAWAEVDRLLASVARGETIFTARPEGDAHTTADVYFSAPDAALPLDQVRPPSTRPGV